MSPNNPHNPNPYAQAAGAYDKHAQAHTPDQRELEARVLIKAAKGLQFLKDNWEKISPEALDDALRYNRQIWLMFVDTAVEDEDPARPVELRNNIANLGVFIFKRTTEILTAPAPEKLDVLIEINREIAAGLMTSPGAKDAKNKPEEPPAPDVEGKKS